MPKVRRDAAELIRRGFGVRTVARKYGVNPGTITKWVKKAEKIGYHPIPTLSSKPTYHPHQLKEEIVRNIVEKRLITKRCSEVVHR
ncbi:MAG: transposase, partial [bacterium]